MHCTYCHSRLDPRQSSRHPGFCSIDHRDQHAEVLKRRNGLALQSAPSTPAPSAIPEEFAEGCPICGNSIPFLARLRGAQYCSSAHEAEHKRRTEARLMERLNFHAQGGAGSGAMQPAPRSRLRRSSRASSAPAIPIPQALRTTRSPEWTSTTGLTLDPILSSADLPETADELRHPPLSLESARTSISQPFTAGSLPRPSPVWQSTPDAGGPPRLSAAQAKLPQPRREPLSIALAPLPPRTLSTAAWFHSSPLLEREAPYRWRPGLPTRVELHAAAIPPGFLPLSLPSGALSPAPGWVSSAVALLLPGPPPIPRTRHAASHSSLQSLTQETELAPELPQQPPPDEPPAATREAPEPEPASEPYRIWRWLPVPLPAGSGFHHFFHLPQPAGHAHAGVPLPPTSTCALPASQPFSNPSIGNLAATLCSPLLPASCPPDALSDHPSIHRPAGETSPLVRDSNSASELRRLFDGLLLHSASRPPDALALPIPAAADHPLGFTLPEARTSAVFGRHSQTLIPPPAGHAPTSFAWPAPGIHAGPLCFALPQARPSQPRHSDEFSGTSGTLLPEPAPDLLRSADSLTPDAESQPRTLALPEWRSSNLHPSPSSEFRPIPRGPFPQLPELPPTSAQFLTRDIEDRPLAISGHRPHPCNLSPSPVAEFRRISFELRPALASYLQTASPFAAPATEEYPIALVRPEAQSSGFRLLHETRLRPTAFPILLPSAILPRPAFTFSTTAMEDRSLTLVHPETHSPNFGPNPAAALHRPPHPLLPRLVAHPPAVSPFATPAIQSRPASLPAPPRHLSELRLSPAQELRTITAAWMQAQAGHLPTSVTFSTSDQEARGCELPAPVVPRTAAIVPAPYPARPAGPGPLALPPAQPGIRVWTPSPTGRRLSPAPPAPLCDPVRRPLRRWNPVPLPQPHGSHFAPLPAGYRAPDSDCLTPRVAWPVSDFAGSVGRYSDAAVLIAPAQGLRPERTRQSLVTSEIAFEERPIAPPGATPPVFSARLLPRALASRQITLAARIWRRVARYPGRFRTPATTVSLSPASPFSPPGRSQDSVAEYSPLPLFETQLPPI